MGAVEKTIPTTRSRILFLDIDGVLCTGEHLKALSAGAVVALSPEARALPEDLRRDCTELDPRAMKRLNRFLLEMTDKGIHVAIVIASTWRLSCTLDELRQILYASGLWRAVPILGVTPKLAGAIPVAEAPRRLRGTEIGSWLAEFHPELGQEDIVILDDSADMGNLLPRLVRTRFEDGLQDEHVQQVRALLSRGSVEPVPGFGPRGARTARDPSKGKNS